MSRIRVALVVLFDAMLIAAVVLLLEIDKLINGTVRVRLEFQLWLGYTLLDVFQGSRSHNRHICCYHVTGGTSISSVWRNIWTLKTVLNPLFLCEVKMVAWKSTAKQIGNRGNLSHAMLQRFMLVGLLLFVHPKVSWENNERYWNSEKQQQHCNCRGVCVFEHSPFPI